MSVQNLRDIIVAGGCFWCVESDLDVLPEVIEVESGYACDEGKNMRPTYEDHSGCREAVRVVYDPGQTKLSDILRHFIRHIDPTDGEGQFYDRGFSYTPAIYVANNEEREIARRVIDDAARGGVYEGDLVVPIVDRGDFYRAEAYHQKYAKNYPEQYHRYRDASGRSNYIAKHT